MHDGSGAAVLRLRRGWRMAKLSFGKAMTLDLRGMTLDLRGKCSYLLGRQVLLSSCCLLRLRKMAPFKGTLHPICVELWLGWRTCVLMLRRGLIYFMRGARPIARRALNCVICVICVICVSLSDPALNVDAVVDIVHAVHSMALAYTIAY